LQTKAKIDLKAGVVELEGGEEFVRLHLEKFSVFLQGTAHHHQVPESDNNFSTPREQLVSAVQKHKPVSKVSGTPRNVKRPTKTKNIDPVRFDLHADQSTQSLEDFIKEKSPKPAADLIAVIGYYLTQIRGAPSFSDGNIEYAYRTLKLKGRPKHLRQIIINQKNTRDWFESADVDGAWKLTRTGQIYVDENLPAKDE
jgi:hypothetical protein